MSDPVYLELKQKQACLFNAKLHLLTMQQTVELIIRAIKDRLRLTHCVINVAKLVQMQKDRSLAEAVNSCDLVNVDGMGLVWGGRFLHIAIPERVTGIDLMQNLFARAEIEGMRIFLLGATSEVLAKMVAHVREKWPRLVIAGYQDGYFQTVDEVHVVDKIQDSQADMLFIAISSPKKELFIAKYAPVLKVPFIMGVGGSFDVLAGRVQRAPRWMQRSGLEWLYRLAQEPRRMWKRYLVTNCLFVWMLIKQKWRSK